MKTDGLKIELVWAADEPQVRDSTIQAELREFGGVLDTAKVRYSQYFVSLHSASVYDYALFELAVQTLAQTAVPVIVAAVSGWFAGRVGRRARVKFGDIEAEAPTPEQVERLLRLAVEYQEKLSNTGKQE